MARSKLNLEPQKFAEEFWSFFVLHQIRVPGYNRAKLDNSEESIKHLKNILESLVQERQAREA